MGKPAAESDLVAAVEAVQQHDGSRTKAAAYLGIPRTTLNCRLQQAEQRGVGFSSPASNAAAAGFTDASNARGGDGSPDPAPRFIAKEIGDTFNIWSVGSAVRTVEDAIAKAEIDLAVWEITEKTVNSWPTAMKIGKGSRKTGDFSETAEQVWNWQIKLKLRRRAPKPLTDALDAIHARAIEHSPRYDKSKIPKLKPPADPHLLEISLFDVHFGKLAWEQETGNNFDLKIVETIYRNAIEDLLARSAGFGIEKILFPVGQDFCNIDNLRHETFAGTRQDTDSRYAKIYEHMMLSLVWAIDFLIQYVPKIEVVLTWGNHDKTVSYHLCRELSAWYRHCPAVEVDYDYRQRKYIEYGVNLVGLTHGNEERHSRLPTLMATENPEAWARTKVREWHLGHYHKKKSVELTAVDTHEGVVVRILPSLSALDAWHYSKGYVGVRAAEAFLWSKRDGRVGYFSVNARE